MSVRNVRYPFTSFSEIDGNYSLELQGHLTREEFDRRIRELNEAGRKSQINRSLVFLPLIIVLFFTAIAVPLIITNHLSSMDDSNLGIGRNTQPTFVVWLWTIVAIFIGLTVATILSSCLNHKSRVNQFRAITKKLNEFNVNDNPRGINWRIDSIYGYIDNFYQPYHSYRYSRTIYTQKYLVIEIGTSSYFVNNQMAPQVNNNTSTSEMNSSNLALSPPPPAYQESVKNN